MKLSRRLQSIDDMVIEHFHHIWDCCCDHGLLGMHLLKWRLGDQIHFVDIVPDITEGLTQNLDKLFPEVGRAKSWMVHCLDLVNLPIPKDALQQKHLVIIAGVGGNKPARWSKL